MEDRSGNAGAAAGVENPGDVVPAGKREAAAEENVGVEEGKAKEMVGGKPD